MKDHPVGLGTYLIDPEHVPTAIHSAIEAGYRRIDCAAVYFNENLIGDALAKEFESGSITREDIFIVSKLASPFHRREHVRIALRKTLTDLRLSYVDLYLIHWPQAFRYVAIDPSKRGYDNEDIDAGDDGRNIDPSVSVHETWEAMEELVDQGLVKHIGVSNFPVSLLHELMTRCKIPPAVNQVEAHPYLQQTRLLNYCEARGVHFQAYSPLGSPGYTGEDEPRILEDPTLTRIAKAHNVSTATICIAWAMQRGTSVVAKSADAKRQAENLMPANNHIRLSETEMEDIAKLERGYRFFRPEDWWGGMAMAVFD
jgi:diketogulonate reductase-like aldo/keto reductase